MTDAHFIRPDNDDLALLPCPFCGGEAERQDIEARDGEDNAGSSYIECTGCGACTQLHFDRKENLLDSWNKRDSAWQEECELARGQLSIARDQRNEYQKKAQQRADSLKGVLASLVAITSLVIRAEDMKCKPSKAVASDKIFRMMLDDYDRATVKARSVLDLNDETLDIEECGNHSAGSPP